MKDYWALVYETAENACIEIADRFADFIPEIKARAWDDVAEIAADADAPADVNEIIWQEMDTSLIYTWAQWEILKQHCSPQDVNWEIAIEGYENDVRDALRIEWDKIADEIAKENAGQEG